MSDRRLLAALLRRDLWSFVQKSFMTLEPGRQFQPNWHQQAICYQLERINRGEIKRLIINVPPRYMKSICVSVAFPAWVLGHDPTRRVICVSYGEDLARKFSIDCRTVMESGWYRHIFPRVGTDQQRQRNMEIVTGKRGGRRAASVGGSLLGHGADLIIVDDPMKPEEAWSEALRRKANEFYDSTLYTRLNDKTKGAIVIVMQRLHEDDLVGHVLEKEDWEVLSIPAIESEGRGYRLGSGPDDVYWREEGELLHAQREPEEILDRIRVNLGSLSFSAQYQQTPLPVEGNFVKRQWLKFYDMEEIPTPLDLIVVSWDTASSESDAADYSVGTVWGLKDGTIYLINVIRGRYQVPELRRTIVDVHLHYDATATLIEDTDIGRAIGQDLLRERRIRPIMRRPRYDKQARLLAQSPRFEEGRVLLPNNEPWLADYIDEVMGFPNGRYDDQVDSTSQALEWLWRKITDGMPLKRPNPKRPQRRPRPQGAPRRRT
jgi:predicted phage terminase large subunit-like protein